LLRNGNEEEITKTYTEMREKFDKIKKDIDKQSKFLSVIEIKLYLIKKYSKITIVYNRD
jgi:hypothetical protein